MARGLERDTRAEVAREAGLHESRPVCYHGLREPHGLRRADV
jgi:hypothetical protein